MMQANAADGKPGLLEHNGICLRHGKHVANDLPRMLHACMHRPAADRPHARVFRVAVALLRVGFLPRAKYNGPRDPDHG